VVCKDDAGHIIQLKQQINDEIFAPH